MNKQSQNILALILILFGFSMVLYICNKKPVPAPPPANLTQLKIYNGTADTVLAYLTLGTTPGCLQNVGQIPFITNNLPGQNNLQGTFKLAPNDSTIAYAPDSLGYNGVISFLYAPNNCPSLGYPNGINQFEFMLNNAYQGANAQESINISCVHGVNCIIRVNCITLNNFNAGQTVPVIQSFANTLNKNQLIAGVYPYGCDTCTGSKTPPACIPLPQPAHKNSVCQVQRNATLSGGLIKIIYMGQNQPLK